MNPSSPPGRLRMNARQQGFTLVEIAIVLVIIGLLLGGILKGQEMIMQARIKNVIADFSGISAAYYGYQDRYRAVPGDDSAATRWTGAVAGDGNGTVAGDYNSSIVNAESRLWWDHLRRAGFVAGTGELQPLNSLAGMLGVQTGMGTSAGSALGGFTSLIMCSANLADKVAIAIDSQMDDGSPNSGAMRAQLQTASNPSITAAAASTYQETGTNVYVACRQI
jgi:prepilin-type N-terminal cleavage/methylation domain-containing protein